MVAPAMDKLALVAAMLIPMVHATGLVNNRVQWYDGLGGTAWQPQEISQEGRPKVIKGPKFLGPDGEQQRNEYFVERCIGAGKENQAYLVRESYFQTPNTPQLCLKMGIDKGGWLYERDFLQNIADTPVGRYFPRIHDSFEWKDKNRGGVQKYVIVMEFFEGFKTLIDFVASYGTAGVPPAVAQQVLTEIVRITSLLHTETQTVTTTKKRRGKSIIKTKTKPLCHADYHEDNIMVKYEDGQVQVKVIDPHMPSQMKPHNAYNDMLFVTKHAVMLACRGAWERNTDRNPKDSMKEAIINELPAGVNRYIHEALGASNFDEAGAVKFRDISDKCNSFWDRCKRSNNIKSAHEMLAYLGQPENRGLFTREA